MAWKFSELTVDVQILHAENNAKKRRLGIWSEPDLVPPTR
jgi:endonuclease YncB( thermonuclease family)